MTTKSSPWIVRPVVREHAALRLFCLPHAGAGSVIFRDWFAALPDSIEVCAIEPPGRLARRNDRAIGDMIEFTEALYAALDPFLDKPFALFGYSLGTLMAFELARVIRRRRKLQPARLIVAAAKAPQLPLRWPPISAEPQAGFVRELERRYGPLEPVIKEEPELFELVVRMMRVDLGMLEGYRYQPEQPFTCPILAVGSREDPGMTLAELEGWRAQTHGAFQAEWLPGGHFFLRNAGAQLRALVAAQLVTAPAPELAL